PNLSSRQSSRTNSVRPLFRATCAKRGLRVTAGYQYNQRSVLNSGNLEGSILNPCMRRFSTSATSILAAALLFLTAGSGTAVASPATSVVYDNIPAPLPPNVASEGFQANGDSEFGEYIQFAGTGRVLSQVTVVMSSYAKFSDYNTPSACPVSSACSASGWSHPITLNLYNVNGSGPTAAPGTLIATKTQTFSMPWRPAPDPSCPRG